MGGTFRDNNYDVWTGSQSGKIFAIRFTTPVGKELPTYYRVDGGSLLEEAAAEDAQIIDCKDENDAIQGDWMYQEDTGGKNIKLRIERNVKNLKECVYTVGNDK